MSADGAGRNWCWSDDADDVVVKSQPAIAVYPGPAGVVIRRQADWDEHDDGMVWFSVDQARDVARAIMAAAGLDIADLDPEPAQAGNAPKDSTGAERQRRYRESKKEKPALFDSEDRNGRNVTQTVTPRDGEAA